MCGREGKVYLQEGRCSLQRILVLSLFPPSLHPAKPKELTDWLFPAFLPSVLSQAALGCNEYTCEPVPYQEGKEGGPRIKARSHLRFGNIF